MSGSSRSLAAARYGLAAVLQISCAAAVWAQTPAFSVIAKIPATWQSMIQGSDGNFYGVTSLDGSGTCMDSTGCGTVSKVTPNGTYSVLYNFQPISGAFAPSSNPIIQATDGNFYGTTLYSSTDCQCGTLFKLTPSGVFTTLYTFGSSAADGNFPTGSLVEGNDGNLYGVTKLGGTNCTSAGGCGTLFQITLQGAYTTIYSFDSIHGAQPSSVIKGSDGNFYGTTYHGGSGGACQGDASTPSGCGTVFQISPGGALTTIYNFQGTTDGSSPYGLVQSFSGSFYGIALNSIFEITPAGALTTVQTFGSNSNGMAAEAPTSLVQASDGNVYGTTGGTAGSSALLQISASNTSTNLYNFCQLGCTASYSVGGYSLIQGNDGNLYGYTRAADSADPDVLFEYALAAPGPVISYNNGIVNGGSFQAGIPSNGWMTIKGTNLSMKSDTWNDSIVNGALPTQLDGVKVTVGGQPAYLEYVSRNQINAIAPSVATGPAQVVVTTSIGTSQALNVQASAVQPAFFEWGTYAVATRQDFSLAVKNGTFPGATTAAAAPGDVIILWGTGFGPTTPAVPAGMETPPTSTYGTASPVTVSIGTAAATVFGAALAPGYAGLYQVAIQIPSSLTNGDYPVVATVNGVQSPSSTLITVSTSP